MSDARVWPAVLDVLGAGVIVERVVFDDADGAVVAQVRCDRRLRARCGRCGSAARVYDRGAGRRRWRHLDACDKTLWLEADAPRVNCVVHGPTVARLPWARHSAGHTYAFDAKVCWLVCRMSKTAVSQLMRIGWATVGRIVARWVADADAARGSDGLDGLARVGIDEVSYKKRHKYLIIVVCHDTGRLVWARRGRDKATVAAFFEQLGAKRCAQITHVSADSATWIADAVSAACPAAVQVADPFHIVGWASEALDQVRRRVWNTVRTPTGRRRHTNAGGQGKHIKDARWALWKNPDDLTCNQAATLAWIKTAHPTLHRAYQYKERLRLLLKLPLDIVRPALAK